MSRTLVLAMVSVAALGASAAPARAATDCEGADAVPTAATTWQAMRSTICLVNVARAAEGLHPVRSALGLRLAAEEHSRDMVRRMYFKHDTPGGRTPIDRIVASGYSDGFIGVTVGEAIGAGTWAGATPRTMVEAWLASPHHRRVMLYPRFREIGIGIEPLRDPAYFGAAYTADFGVRHRPG